MHTYLDENEPVTKIHEFVTGTPLSESEKMKSDEHGNFPVSPLGFPRHNVSGFDPEMPNENCPRTAVAKFGVGYGDGIPSQYADAYKISTNYPTLYGNTIRFHVQSVISNRNADTGLVESYMATIIGDVRDTITEGRTSITAHFINAGEDDFSNTKIIDDDFVISWADDGNCIFDAETGCSLITIPKADLEQCKVTGTVPDNKLILVLENTIQYVYLYGQSAENENGIYSFGSTNYEKWGKLSNYDHRAIALEGDDFNDPDKYPYADASVNDNVEGHRRKGYSEREIAEYLKESVGNITRAATHPISIAGDLAGAGAFTSWFASCGTVDISDGVGAHPVMVNGFGLGSGYTSVCPYRQEFSDHYRYDANGEPNDLSTTTKRVSLQPWILFGYGAKHDATYEGTGAPALPQDWPYTGISEYKGREYNNNITLLKNTVKLKGTNTDVGGLERDEWDDCEQCAGLGTNPCPDCGGAGGTCARCEGTGLIECDLCHGTGQSNIRHLLMNRLHLCLFNDFSPSDDSNGHTDGTTVLKKTFVHLPTPLDTEDGEEYELTVSLPTENIDAAFPGSDTTMDRSGYYAYVSQPRVYVLSGYWKFSNSRVHIIDPCNNDYKSVGGYFKLGTDAGFYDKDGELIPEGTAIRITIDGGNNYPRYNTFIGTLIYNGEYSAVLKLKGKFPYDVGGRRWAANNMSACGLAYIDSLEDEQENLNNITKTPLGLHTRNAATLSTDYGDGSDGDLNVYNRFFTIKDNVEGRDSVVSYIDKRSVIATVYPTVTNTFGWDLANRQKLRHLDKIMTTEGDSGRNSITEAAWYMNSRILGEEHLKGVTSKKNGSYNITPDVHPLAYKVSHHNTSTDKGLPSAIATQLKVHLPDTIDVGYIADSGNPVRQAQRAYGELVEDFKRLRMNYNLNSAIGLNNSSILRYSTATVESLETISFAGGKSFNAAGMSTDNPASEFWRMKVRHLPEYIRAAGQDSTSENQSQFGWNAFTDTDLQTYYGKNIYGYGGYYTSTDAIEDTTCELIGAPGLERAYADRSVINALAEVNGSLTNDSAYDDLLRYAEMQTINGNTYNSIFKGIQLAAPNRHRLGTTSPFLLQLDAFHPFTKIFSMDSIPFPSAVEYIGTAYKDIKQRPFISGDAWASYRYQASDDGVEDEFEFVSTTLPTSTALANFVKNYITCYAAQMPIRFWDGTRIAIAANGIGDTSVTGPAKRIYLSRMKWFDQMLNDCANAGELRSQYINDTMISRSNDANPIDDNMSWATFTDNNGNRTEIEGNWSAPPYTVTKNFYNDERNGDHDLKRKVGYVRVFMKFKFSADSGRWYTVDYRQSPIAYLSPLYGAEALEARMPSVFSDETGPAKVTVKDGNASSNATQKVWRNSLCSPGGTWTDVMKHPYFKYLPMDINLGVVPFLFNEFPYDKNGKLKYPEYNSEDGNTNLYMQKLMYAHLPVSEGGVGLYPPSNCNGEYNAGTKNGIHANFWSVREHLRPAVSCLANTDVPQFYYDSEKEAIVNRSGGSMGDATIWGQYDYPRKGLTDYHLPSPYNPYDDTTKNFIMYSNGGFPTGIVMADGNRTALSFYNDTTSEIIPDDSVPPTDPDASITTTIGPVENIEVEYNDETAIATWTYSLPGISGYKVFDNNGYCMATIDVPEYEFTRYSDTRTYYIAPYGVEACVEVIGERTEVIISGVEVNAITLLEPTDGVYYGLNWAYEGKADRFVIIYGDRSYDIEPTVFTQNLVRNNETDLSGRIYAVLNGSIGPSAEFTVPALHKIVPHLKSEDATTATWEWENTNVNHISGYRVLGLNAAGEWVVIDTLEPDVTEYEFTKDAEVESYIIHPLTYMDYKLIDSDVINISMLVLKPVDLTWNTDWLYYIQHWDYEGNPLDILEPVDLTYSDDKITYTQHWAYRGN